MMKYIAAVLLCIAFFLPVAASAQTDLQSQMMALFTQIITLQKQLIESLQNEVVKLSTQLANLKNTNASTASVYKCAKLTPPLCATAITVTYDSYNCVTGYACKPSTTTQTTTNTTGASCSSYNGMRSEGTILDGSMILTGQPYYGGAIVLPMWQCKAGVWICHKWCTPGATFNYPYGISPSASCTFENTPVGSQCGGYYHCAAGVNYNYWSSTLTYECTVAR